MTVCGRCLESYQRWATNPQRHPDSHPASSKRSDAAKKASGRSRKRQRAATETEARERYNARMRIQLIGITAAIATAACGLISLLAYALFSNS